MARRRLLLKLIKCPICSTYAANVDELYQHLLTHKCRKSCDILFHKNGKCSRTPPKKLSCWKCKHDCDSVRILMHHLENECTRCSACTLLNCECEVDLATYDPVSPGTGHAPQPTDTGQVPGPGEPGSVPDAGQVLERGRLPECLRLPQNLSPQPSTSRAAQIGMGHSTVTDTTIRDEIRNKRCSRCGISFHTVEQYQDHITLAHPSDHEAAEEQPIEDPLHIRLSRSAFNDAYQLFNVDLDNLVATSVHGLFGSLENQAFRILKRAVRSYRNYKLQIEIECEFHKEDGDSHVRMITIPMSSFLLRVENEKHAEVIYRAIREIFEVRVEEFQHLGSGWVLSRITSFSMLIAKLGKMIGGRNMPIPPVLKAKNKSLLNVPGHDGKCFARALIAHFLIKQHERLQLKRKRTHLSEPPRINQKLRNDRIYKPYLKDGAVQADGKTIINWNTGLPFDLKNIDKFENDNPTLAIDYFVYDQDEESILCVNPPQEASIVEPAQASNDLPTITTESSIEVENEVMSGSESGEGTSEESEDDSSDVESNIEENDSVVYRNIESGTQNQVEGESNETMSGEQRLERQRQLNNRTRQVNVANLTRSQQKTDKERKRHEEIMLHTYPYHICKEVRPIQINVLLVMDGDQKHFCFIKDLKAFFKRTKNNVKAICPYCLHSIYSRDHKDHIRNCALVGVRKIRMPSPGDKLRFTKFMNTQKMPFVIFADMESALLPTNHSSGNTTTIHKHKACAYCWACIDQNGSIVEMKSYAAIDDDEKVAETMMSELLECASRCVGKIKSYEKEANKKRAEAFRNVPLPGVFDPMPDCGFCHKPIPSGKAHRHHEHTAPFAFKFLACQPCNMHAQVSQSVNCFMHNLKGYDAHYLLRVAQNKNIVQEMEVIPISSEKFLSIKVNDVLTFMDSLNFFSASLDSVASSMDQTDFRITRNYFEQKFNAIDNIHENVKKLLSKGEYPYSYITGTSTLDETCLPPKEAFFNDLRDKPISDEDYAHAKDVWDTFKIENMREYTLQYVERDVLVLADCFVKMRELFIDKFGIDCAHYYTLPQLSFDLALKFTKCELDFITDPSMHTWLELMKRGGMACGGNVKHFKANNPYLPDYDRSKETSYICYHDLNNLYPFSMCSYLPQKHFSFLNEFFLDHIRRDGVENFVKNLDDEADVGYFFEVDLHFPPELHEKFEQLTPVPYHRSVKIDELSPLQQEFAEELGISDRTVESPRLIADLHDRERYKVHYRVLKFYLELGVKITKLHSGIRFTQAPYLKPYLEELAKCRRLAKTKVEQNFWKLLGNVLFGKSCENVRNRSRVVVINSEEKALKYNSKPNVGKIIIIDKEDENDDDLALVCMKPTSVYLNRPIYIGVTTLDESKRIYYNYFYNFCLPQWNRRGRSIETLGGDTDSVFFCVKTQDVYKDMKANEELWFDMSDYSRESPRFKQFHSDMNKKRLGYMKDELANKVISEFVYLRPKMYSYRYYQELPNGEQEEHVHGDREYLIRDVKKGKGIPRVALEKQCQFEDFVECVRNPIQKKTTSMAIRSKKHTIHTVRETRNGLAAFDVKRYALDYNYTLPFNHKKLCHDPLVANIPDAIDTKEYPNVKYVDEEMEVDE